MPPSLMRWAGLVFALALTGLVAVSMVVSRHRPTSLLSTTSLLRSLDRRAAGGVSGGGGGRAHTTLSSLIPSATSPVLEQRKAAQAALVLKRDGMAGFHAKAQERHQRAVAREGDNGWQVAPGAALCAEGETECEHPCSAFYTITGQTSDCKCKCKLNPASHIQGDVICDCPGAPISPENNQFPGAAAAAAAAAAASSSSATAPAPAAAAPPAAAPAPAAAGARAAARGRGQAALARLFGGGAAATVLPVAVPGGAGAVRPMFWVGPPPAILPPDGDYPGGSTGIPPDGYADFDTSHGVSPYHGPASFQGARPPVVGFQVGA